ncbi:MAG TPA: serine/threonine-protein kinase [Vicinamibacteria bacterium]|nr:serine/threonine-protein kinase [Vicinamibacteria bacterium]
MSTCPACARPVTEVQRFCPGCGSSLDVADSPTGTAPRPLVPRSNSPSPPRASSTPRPPRGSGPAGARPGERFAPGTVLGERYRIVGLLGRGGMGEVYRADDLKLDQPVALKFLPRALEGDSERLERLFSEVRMARQVSHPAVCRVWDIGEAEGQHFLSMEFVDGENLASLLRRIGRLPQDKALDIVRQVAAGLAAAHEKGVLHRDLKPANVMLDGQGKVRLTDFGLAGLAEAVSGEDVRSGTPSYMSPEQLQGREVTVRSDIYALGLLIYELVTGRRAFEGKGLAELTRKHRDERPIDPSVLVPDLDPAVERTIVACLEKDPKRRPPSALVVSAMLAGRDPLEAAIAAGETPSPELVAAAGETEGLRPRVAVACLAAVVVAVLAVPFLQWPLHIYSRVPVEKEPAALQDRARELLARLGHVAPAVDDASGLTFDAEYFLYLQKKDRSASRWEALRTGDPPVALYWYRQSPRPLAPLRTGGLVTWGDPPQLVSGMAAVKYDLSGRLIGLAVVPPQVEPAAAAPLAPADWAPLFEASRLDPAQLRAVSPSWAPPFHTDARAAWEGTWPRQPGIPIRVEAAAYRGRLVWFQIVSPWTRPERDEPFPVTEGQKAGRAAVILLLLALIATGAFLAKRNIRLGRGDRRGAFRLALVFFGLGAAGLLIGAHHVADAAMEIFLLARGAGTVMLVAGLIWLFYLALEPYVRKLRPWTLISWARLLGGGWCDAVVGRDALIGMVWGAVLAVILLAVQRVPVLLGHAAPLPNGGNVEVLLGASRLLADVVSLPISATLLGLGALLLFLVLRFLTRRDLPAAVLLIAVLTLFLLAQAEESAWLMLPLGLVIYVSYAVLLLRFGVLSAIAGAFTVDILVGMPLFPDLGQWTASGTLVVVPLVIGLAALAFRAAVGGHSGLRRYVAGEAPSSHS